VCTSSRTSPNAAPAWMPLYLSLRPLLKMDHRLASLVPWSSNVSLQSSSGGSSRSPPRLSTEPLIVGSSLRCFPSFNAPFRSRRWSFCLRMPRAISYLMRWAGLSMCQAAARRRALYELPLTASLPLPSCLGSVPSKCSSVRHSLACSISLRGRSAKLSSIMAASALAARAARFTSRAAVSDSDNVSRGVVRSDISEDICSAISFVTCAACRPIASLSTYGSFTK
jgi:hypothetical protein